MAEGDPVTKKANDVGVPMIEGSPDEPIGPEDAAGIGDKRGDYSTRNDGQKHFSMERDADGDIVAVDQSAIIESGDQAVPPEGTKGGVTSAEGGGAGTQNTRYTLTLTGVPTGGDVVLTDQDGVDHTVAFDNTAAETLAALLTGATFDEGDVAVTGADLPGGLQTIEFTGDFEASSEPTLEVTENNLTGGTAPNATLTKTQTGGEGPG